MTEPSEPKSRTGLTPFMSPAGALALSLGTSIGWGSVVVTSNTYLLQAGPVGSVLGMLFGACIMLIIARNYHYMVRLYPEAGGVYSYTKEAFGYDYGFLTSWFLALTYLAVFWANATSIPLFARYFLGDIFRFGRLYSIFGYTVYFGEILLTLTGIILAVFLCAGPRKLSAGILTVLVTVFVIGVTVCFAGAMLKHSKAGVTLSPSFIPDRSTLGQVVLISCISPWAFIGFENISHAAEEFRFSRSRVFRILVASVVITTALYCFVLLLSVTAYPPEYGSWLAYIRDLSSLSGINGIPAFYAANAYLGSPGVILLMLTLLALIITSLIGNLYALSRLFYALAKDSVVPPYFAVLNRRGVPERALILAMLLSVPIPFLGRTAIGWIVDVTTIGATLIYGFVSASTYKIARESGDRTERITGLAGMLLMVGFLLYLLVPNLFTSGSMEKESYFLFVVWSILGFVYFRIILQQDNGRRFGKSLIVWIALLSLVLVIALIWMNQTMISSAETAMDNIHLYYQAGGELSAIREGDEQFVQQQVLALEQTNIRTMLIVAMLFVFSIVILFTNYNFMSKRAKENEQLANTDPMTGVKSKHAYLLRETELNSRIKSGKMEPFSTVVCDVNGLKYINDTFGHKAGDDYIRSASALICETFQHSPVFRIGGDEFAVLLFGRDFENREALLGQINQRVEDNIELGKVIISIGMADFLPGKDDSAHAVFERADGYMYQRKRELKAAGARSR